jgi:hypothetical protein
MRRSGFLTPTGRSDQKAGPPFARDRPTRRGQQNSIDGPEWRRAGLSPEDAEFVAKDEDLEVLGTTAIPGSGQETREQSNDQAEEEQHQWILECGQS